MSSQNWFHRNVSMPVGQNFIAAALGALAVSSSQVVVTWFGGCTDHVASEAMRGETALNSGDVAKAKRIASDLAVEAGNCNCSNGLGAAVAAAQMRQAKIVQDANSQEFYRSICFRLAVKAKPIVGHAPRIEALIEECRAG